jgi:hypothetical protein
MAISKDLEPLIFKKFSARRQPWWRLEEFGPPNLERVPTPVFSFSSAALIRDLLQFSLHESIDFDTLSTNSLVVTRTCRPAVFLYFTIKHQHF